MTQEDKSNGCGNVKVSRSVAKCLWLIGLFSWFCLYITRTARVAHCGCALRANLRQVLRSHPIVLLWLGKEKWFRSSQSHAFIETRRE